MSMQEQLTPTPIVHLDLEARLWMLSVKWMRYLHFITNVICFVLALTEYSSYVAIPKTNDEAEEDKSGNRIFFLLIVTLLMIASLALLIGRCTLSCIRPKHTTLLKPKYEVIYYAISCVSLFVALLVLAGSIASSEGNFSEHKHVTAAVGLAAFNVWMYFRSAFRLWVLSTPQS